MLVLCLIHNRQALEPFEINHYTIMSRRRCCSWLPPPAPPQPPQPTSGRQPDFNNQQSESNQQCENWTSSSHLIRGNLLAALLYYNQGSDNEKPCLHCWPHLSPIEIALFGNHRRVLSPPVVPALAHGYNSRLRKFMRKIHFDSLAPSPHLRFCPLQLCLGKHWQELGFLAISSITQLPTQVAGVLFKSE